MTNRKNVEMFKGYKSGFVRITNKYDYTSFYGFLKDVNEGFITVFPYLTFRIQEDGEAHPILVEEGKPFRIRTDSAFIISPSSKEEINNLISSHERSTSISEKKKRLEEITVELQLIDMEKTYKKAKSGD